MTQKIPPLIFSSLFLLLVTNACQQTATPFEEKVLLNYFDPAVTNYPTGDPGVAATNVREQAMRLYKEANYDQAIILFDEIITSSPSDQDRSMWLYYKANALIAMRKLAPAKESLSYIAKGYSRYNSVDWLNALLLIREGKRNEATKILERLTFDRKYKNQATEVLELMNKEK